MQCRRTASGIKLHWRAIIIAACALCCSACAAMSVTRLPDSAAHARPLIRSGDAAAHGVTVRAKNGSLNVKSYTIGNRTLVDERREAQRDSSSDTGTNVEITYIDSEKAAEFQRLSHQSGETLEFFRRRVFGEESVVLHARIKIVPPAEFGRHRYASIVADNAAELRFMFKADNLSVAGDDALSWFAPLETVMHETYHVQAALDRIERSGADSPSGGPQSKIMEEAAAIVIAKCAGLQAFSKTTIAREINVNLNNGERQGTLTDQHLRALLSEDLRIKKSQLYYLSLLLFNTIWAEFFGAEGYVTRDDDGADGFLRLCRQDSIGRPESLTPLIRELAEDGADAPEFPESFGLAPESWINFEPSPGRAFDNVAG